MNGRRHVVVVGGGITGLAAAWQLTKSVAAPRVTVVEADERLGGKIKTTPFAGTLVEEGPDAFLARRPEAVTLCREVGLGDDLVAPAATSALVWSRGRLRVLPEGQVLGVPARFMPLLRSGILPPLAAVRAAIEPLLPGTSAGPDDIAVGEVVRRRYGRAVDQRLADPLIGGINAGRTVMLSADVVAPQVAAAARAGRSLSRALRHQLASAPSTPDPLFLAPRRGLGRLVDRLDARLRAENVDVVQGVRVGALERVGERWSVVAGSRIVADGVVLAVPAGEAAPLVAPHAPEAARVLHSFGTASVALVTLAYPRGAFPDVRGASGFLVPNVERRFITACTYASAKWAAIDEGAEDVVIVRASVGRVDDERFVSLDDDVLVARVQEDVVAMAGARAHPVQWRVSRWPASFPQFEVGHLTRVEGVEGALAASAPGIALAGASYRGVGIPACIASARRAVAALGY